jgi:hypothetical protein
MFDTFIWIKEILPACHIRAGPVAVILTGHGR